MESNSKRVTHIYIKLFWLAKDFFCLWFERSLFCFQALEGIGDSQEVKSEDIALSRSDGGGGDAVEFDDKEGESLSRSEDDKTDDFIGFSRLSLRQ